MNIVEDDKAPSLLMNIFFVHVGISYYYWWCSNKTDRRRKQSAWKKWKMDHGLFSFLAEV